ncbi:transglycosylase domain-containing protein [Peribacillus kribbensis]|uniref:transglycosylase domain-containing protein n=1 Tax=Peribacillus kribbensis TaxID=356658 RepID=UPI00041F5F64|nr:transglycosylase domain-containing protein [Peribacillus kribbensis]
MRTFTGYLILLLLLPILLFLLIMADRAFTDTQHAQEEIQKKLDIKNINLPQNSKLMAADGKIFTEFHEAGNRIYITDPQIPVFLKQLFVATEDRHFYTHHGFDAMGISRAVIADSRSGSRGQGGSTITQQLARNLFLTQEKTFNRKLAELLYSQALEKHFSKQKILELYINTIYFQNGAYGIEAASQLYFGKSTGSLSKAELAFLSAIPNNPSLYDPFTHFNLTKKRQERMVKQMYSQGLISAAEYKSIISAPVVLMPERKKADLYPDYTSYVRKEFTDLVAEEEGYTSFLESPDTEVRNAYAARLNRRVKKLLDSGIVIHTALNTRIQDKALKSIRTHLPDRNIEGSVIVIEHHTHKLVSLIGGKYYKNYSFNRGFQSFRQPGSAIKPLLVYAPYIETRQPSLQQKVSANQFCSGGYCPHNYDNKEHGMVTLEQAFAHSYNTPAVRLFNAAGIEKAFSYITPFRFSKVTKEDHRLPAAVGGFTFGMSPLELTGAYTSFENGYYQPPRAILEVTGADGELLYKWHDKAAKVWSSRTVSKIRILLQKTVTDGTARKAYFPSDFIGGKTGTTNDYKDLWFIGLTDQYTGGVWVGKDLPSSIESQKTKAPHLLIWKDTLEP